MAQTVQILRTNTNNPPPALLPGALSVELGTQTKLWVGAAGGNRLLMSSDPNDIALSSSCVVAATPPSNPIPGLLWWDSTGGQLYVRYQDINSTAWIAAASATGAFLPISGGTLTGPLILAAPPTVTLEAATKGYVDTLRTYVDAADALKLPLAGGILTGNLTLTPAASDASLTINKPAGNFANVVYGTRAGSARWGLFLGDFAAESTGNAGSDFAVGRYSDASAFIDFPLSINRATGNVTMTTALYINKTTATPSEIYLQRPSGQHNSIYGRTGTAGTGLRWLFAVGNNVPESGSNVGSNIGFYRYDDAGGYLATALSIVRSSGVCQNETGTWQAVSDAAVKRNIQPYTRGLADLVNLEPVTFQYNGVGGTANDADDVLRYGLVAQQVQPHVPEIVGPHIWTPVDETGQRTGEPEVELLGVDPGRLMYAVINALKTIDARLAAGGL